MRFLRERMSKDRYGITNLKLVNRSDLVRLRDLLGGWKNRSVKKIRVMPNGALREEGVYHLNDAVLVETEDGCFLQVLTSGGIMIVHTGDFIEKLDEKKFIIRRSRKDPWNIYKDILRIVEEQ